MFGDKKEKKQDRFIVKEEQLLTAGYLMVIVDSLTGVNYIMTGSGDSTHVTPLLDRNGEIMVDDITIM